MTRRFWRVAAFLFILVNVGGAGFAIAERELAHAAIHVVLVPVGWLVWLLASRRGSHDPTALLMEERLDRLQHSLDAMAIDVERIGEAQRYALKVMGEAGERSEVEGRRSEV